MSNLLAGLERVFSIESHGTRSKIKMHIFLDIGRELTENDKNNILNYGNALTGLITAETQRIDPVNIQEAIEVREKILDLFAGRDIFVEEIPNKYDNRINSPWFVVTTKSGRITIGWRKRVINIDWSDSIIPHYGAELFKDEGTDFGDKYIHAWGYEAAKEYLDKLLA